MTRTARTATTPRLFAILDDGPNDLSHHDFLIVA